MASSTPSVTPSSASPRPMLGVFALAMLNLAVVCTLRGLPIMAEEGFSLIFYFVVVVVGIGVVGAVFTFVIGFFPPSQIDTGGIVFYEFFLIGGTILMCTVPFLIVRLQKPGWKQQG